VIVTVKAITVMKQRRLAYTKNECINQENSQSPKKRRGYSKELYKDAVD